MVDILLLRPEMVTRSILDILNVLTPTQKLSLGEARNIITLQIKSNHYMYVLYEDGEPLACGGFAIITKLGRNGSRDALIEEVVVRADKQRNGYGRKLIAFLLKKIEQYNVYAVWLNCSDENVPFYKKCGFEKTGNQMKVYYGKGV
jgi:glucosamine-phosphate N-acetyltransferase